MAAKREEYELEINGLKTTMLLDSEDAERYRKGGAKLKRKTVKVASTQESEDSDTTGAKNGEEASNKAMKSPANK